MANRVRPEVVQVGDRIATKTGIWFTVGDIKTTLMPKAGWPDDPTINPTHVTVYTFSARDDEIAPYNHADHELIEHEPSG